MLAVSAHLTVRDRYLVRLVGEHRVLTTSQLTALGFGNITTARHRLSVLVGLGLLRRFRPHPETGSAPWHYLLGPVGAAMLGAEDRDTGRWLPQVRAGRQLALERSPRLAHMTGRNGFFTALIQHARQDGGDLTQWLNEAAAASRCEDAVLWAGDRGQMPRPDGAGTWAEDGHATAFLLEYDTGSEHLPVLAGKLEGYQRLAANLAWYEQPCPVLLFAFPSPRRERSARRALAATQDAASLRIATMAADPTETSPAGPVWLPLYPAVPGQVRLAWLDAAVPDPWRQYRAQRAAERRAAAARDQAYRLPGDDQDGTGP